MEFLIRGLFVFVFVGTSYAIAQDVKSGPVTSQKPTDGWFYNHKIVPAIPFPAKCSPSKTDSFDTFFEATKDVAASSGATCQNTNDIQKSTGLKEDPSISNEIECNKGVATDSDFAMSVLRWFKTDQECEMALSKAKQDEKLSKTPQGKRRKELEERKQEEKDRTYLATQKYKWILSGNDCFEDALLVRQTQIQCHLDKDSSNSSVHVLINCSDYFKSSEPIRLYRTKKECQKDAASDD